MLTLQAPEIHRVKLARVIAAMEPLRLTKTVASATEICETRSNDYTDVEIACADIVE